MASLHILYALGIATVALIALSFVVRRPAWRRLLRAASVFLVASVLLEIDKQWTTWLGLQARDSAMILIGRALGILWWLALAQTAVDALELFLWDGLLARDGVRRVPKLLAQLVAVLIYTGAVFSILSYTFEQSLTGLLATSGVVAVVLGFALQTTLADVFTGVALNLERPFRIGDWIRVDKDIVGQVIEHNWRATRIRTRDNNHVILPNSMLGKSTLTNYNYPDNIYAIRVQVSLGYDLAPGRARAALSAATLACEGVLSEPAPAVSIIEFADSVIRYEVRCYVRDYRREPEHRTEIAEQVWQYLDRTGIPIPFPRHEIQLLRPRPASARPLSGPAALLAAIEVFAPLAEEQRATLAESMVRRVVARGQALVRQGEAGSSLFVVADGLCYVIVQSSAGAEQIVARLRPGEFFGEMSLLTGEPRSATVCAATDGVVYEMPKALLTPVLQGQPEVAVRLGRVLAERKLVTETLHRERGPLPSDAEVKTYAEQFLRRIRLFFGLR